jgi:dUTP pyrophosphatase
MDIKISVADSSLIPEYAYVNDAGCDLKSAEEVTIQAGDRLIVDTGVMIGLPANMVALVAPRSGLAAKHGLTVLNSPGVIDSGYTGNIKVILLNTGKADYTVKRGDRIAQLLFQEVKQANFVIVDDLNIESDRSIGGLGSSGK